MKYSFFEMEISKLSDYLINMCQSPQGIMVLYFEIYSMIKIFKKLCTKDDDKLLITLLLKY
jgi:hypothetical protein